MNNEEVRPTANLIISTCSAYDYLNHSNPNLEKLTTQYYETFSITDRFTGYFSNILILLYVSYKNKRILQYTCNTNNVFMKSFFIFPIDKFKKI